MAHREMKYHRLDGPAVVRLREAAGLSQAQLAEQSGIAAPYLSQLENGRKRPSPDVAARLARELGVELARILRPVEAAS
jgi:transcriptional regulator with XRE-family HTH domain